MDLDLGDGAEVVDKPDPCLQAGDRGFVVPANRIGCRYSGSGSLPSGDLQPTLYLRRENGGMLKCPCPHWTCAGAGEGFAAPAQPRRPSSGGRAFSPWTP